jgi:hypothetical protein
LNFQICPHEGIYWQTWQCMERREHTSRNSLGLIHLQFAADFCIFHADTGVGTCQWVRLTRLKTPKLSSSLARSAYDSLELEKQARRWNACCADLADELRSDYYSIGINVSIIQSRPRFGKGTAGSDVGNSLSKATSCMASP